MKSHAAGIGSDSAGSGSANAALVLLMVAAFFSFLDRQILTLLVVPIERDLGIGDLQIGILQGPAFSLFFSIVAMPLGFLVDRYHRWRILGTGIMLWSLATMASGLATNFHELLICRMLVGIGEASLMPAAYSLLSDCFAPERRGRAFSVFAIGTYAGGGGSLLLGGVLLTALGASSNLALPFVGELAVWRAMFVLVGIPGLIVAAIALSRHDPARTAGSATNQVAVGIERDGNFLAYLRKHAGVFAGVWTAYSALAFVTYTFLPWAPVALGRGFGLSPGSIGMTFGLVQLAVGILGALFAGSLADRWTRQALRGGKFRLTLFMWLGGIPGLALIAFGDSLALALIGIAVYILCNTMSYVSAAAAIQDMVPSSLRGQATAFWYLISGVVGLGGGPYATAWMNVHVAPAWGGGLGLAMLLATAPALIIGLIATVLTARNYDRLRQERAANGA